MSNRAFAWIVTAAMMGGLAACGNPQTSESSTPETFPTEQLMAETEISIPNPTVTPVTPLPENLPPGLPSDFTPYELTAAQAGQTAYSGYNCSLSAESCVCDQPTVQSVIFTFQPGNKMIYQFTGETYGAQWEMTRLVPDQWSYILQIGVDESGGAPAEGGGHFFLLTFTKMGFKLAQREDLGNDQEITCPEAVFTRMTR